MFSKIKTPSYIINQADLDKNCADFLCALKKSWNNFILGYSVKTNSLPWIISYLRSKAFYAEVVSETEYDLALRAGYPPQNIIYNGPAKSKDSFLFSIKNNSILNIDSNREIEYLESMDESGPFNVGIRVNFDVEAFCPGQSECGVDGGRFGFNLENGKLREAVERIRRMNNVHIVGLHLHTSSKTRSVDIYRILAKKACEIKQQFHLQLKYIDIGGGFFGGLPGKPSFTDYCSAISDELKKAFSVEQTALIVEPGTSIIASPIKYICKVIDVKETNKNIFVVTNGSRIHIDPLMHKKDYFLDTTAKNESIMEKQIISGFTSMDNDRITELNHSAKLDVNDYIIFKKVGAYTMSFSPLFIKYFPTVYWETEDTLLEVRAAWGVDEYIAKNIFWGEKQT